MKKKTKKIEIRLLQFTNYFRSTEDATKEGSKVMVLIFILKKFKERYLIQACKPLPEEITDN
jgi:hypothetical protein